MVRVGPSCIDKYEDSIWDAPTGGHQITGALPCSADGQDCAGKIFARSVAGVTPAASVTWFQAQVALADSGKRLPSNAEWQAAVTGTPNGSTTAGDPCFASSGSVQSTGSRPACVSSFGAYDMVGNLYEWVADWVPQTATCASWGAFSADDMCLAGASTTATGPGAVIRGGHNHSGAAAGPFAVNATYNPSLSRSYIGFRGAR
jgi:formylglycine-generating enzyme required for sulfatase activity